MTVIILAALALLGSTLPAAADPASLLIAGFNALAGTTISASAAATAIGTATITIGQLVNAALFVALAAASTLFRQGVDPSKAKETFVSSESPVIRGYGRVRIGGLKIYGNTTGLDRYRLVGHLAGPIDGIEQTWLGGREVIVEDDGAVSSPPYAKYGGSYVHIASKIGDGTETAWADLVAAFPGLWTADHRVRGIFQTLVKYTSPGMSSPKFLRLYSGGVPDVERVVRSSKVYDPRDEGQIADDDFDVPSTWSWSDNAVLVATDAIRRNFFRAAEQWDWARTALEAGKADEEVATLTGTEPLARLWGLVSDEEARGDAILKLLDSAGLELIDGDDGYFVAVIDDDRQSELTIPAKHIGSITLVSGPESVERPNLCIVKYYSPERNFEISEINMAGIGWARIDEEISDTGLKPVTLEFPFCPSASQAQRLARRKFALLRADRVQVKTNFVGLAAWGVRVVSVATAAPEVITKLAIEPPRVDDAEGQVEIIGVEWPDLSQWDPDTMEAPAPSVVPDIPADAALDTPEAPTQIEPILYPDGSAAVRVAFSADSGLTPECTVRVWSGAFPSAWAGMTERRSGTYWWSEKAGMSAVGARIDARVRVFDAEEESSNWSATTTVGSAALSTVAPDAPSIGYDGDRFVVFVSPANNLQIASVATAGAGAPGLVSAGPGVVIEWDPGSLPSGSNTFTATAYSSTGAASATASITVVI